ncbi:MAG: NTP transferase domain-containing protein [Oligoflexia bacterium]|nr:NTP transferase domain-containing protein [Oligoflexia bacterium]
MNIDACYILGAGKGTRMGELGKVIPKVIFPFFEKTLFFAQYKYAKSLGINRIFTNTHHLSEQVTKYIKEENLDVTILFEKDLLGSGGAIHNLKKYNPELKKILILNSDVFLLSETAENIIQYNKSEKNILFAIPFEEKEKYNSIKSDIEGSFLGIVDEYTGYTFSGISIINLELLDYKEGKSNYFGDVVRVDGNTSFVKLHDLEYWDFGTLDLYKENVTKLLQNESKLKSFLSNQRVIEESCLKGSVYQNKKIVIDLENDSIEYEGKKI